mgnify:FL=1
MNIYDKLFKDKQYTIFRIGNEIQYVGEIVAKGKLYEDDTFIVKILEVFDGWWTVGDKFDEPQSFYSKIKGTNIFIN